jgi:6-phosphogluconolactonase (cycloisomerase 2 family)
MHIQWWKSWEFVAKELSNFIIILVLISATRIAHGQLDEHCTISILNRSTQVQPDGTWHIDNVPAGFGFVRARATCVQDGKTQFGQSNLFQLNANHVTGFNAKIVLGSIVPIPTSLAIATPIPTLSQAGQTEQLTASATYADGTTKDVTIASAGTIYTVSNPTIATVSGDGLVTAVSTGTVVIQAVNEGRQSITSIQVIVAGASHGGIPDSWAIAHGLDPNDPAMPFEDPDHDGLTNLQEFQNGTDPHNPDTDGDGLTDGQEVLIYHTNPVLFSTDGTGIPDGIEVQTGTLGGTLNAKLTAALSSIEVKPSAFTLAVNSLVGEASTQLRVLGHLIDGKTTIDLTSTEKDTNYSSNDLNVCNFGAPDGNIFAGINGVCTISVANSGHTASVGGVVQSFSPTAVSFAAIPGFANSVAVVGDLAFVAAGGAGLQIVNVSPCRTNPQIVSSVSIPGNANDVTVLGNFAYLAMGKAGLAVVDITNPLRPQLLSTLATSGNALDVVVRGTKGYVANGSNLLLVDVTNPASPSQISTLPLNGTIQGVDVDTQRNLAVVAAGTSGIYVVDISSPNSPVLLGTAPAGDARDVVIRGNIVFVADFQKSATSVDITTPSAPVVLSHIVDPNLGGFLQDIILSGNFALGADVKFVNGIPITDISDPANLHARAILNFPQRDDNAMGIAADGTYVYLATEHSNLSKFGSFGDSRLYIGQYLPFNRIPPTVSIISPASGSTVIADSTGEAQVNATDDVGVASAKFFINGQIASTSATKPYRFTFTAPQTPGVLTLGANAVDCGGNVGTAQDVKINIIPDPDTTVVGSVIDNNNHPIAGATVTISGGSSSVTQLNGSFSIANIPTLQSHVVRNITVNASIIFNGAPLTASFLSTHAVPGGTTNAGVLTLIQNASSQPAGGLVGTIFSLSGAPIANLPVQLHTTNSNFQVNTDSGGRFAFFEIPAGAASLEAVDAATHSRAVSTVTVIASQNISQDLSLILETGSVSGIVRDQSASPVAGAQVTVTAANGTFHLTTTPDGKYSLAGVQIGAIAVGVFNPSDRKVGRASGLLASPGATVTVDVTIFPVAEFLFTVGSANVASFAVRPDTGEVAEVPGSPFSSAFSASPCPILATTNPAGKLLFIPDGCNDSIAVFSINPASGSLSAVPGSPFAIGTPTPDGGSPQPVMHPSGKFLYVSGIDHVAAFNVQPDGSLIPIVGSPFQGGGEGAMAIHPSGRFLYLADSLDDGTAAVTTFSVDQNSGALSVTGAPFAVGCGPNSVLTAGCVLTSMAIDPLGGFMYVSTSDPNGVVSKVLALAIDATSGGLSPILGSPFSTNGINSTSVSISPDGRFMFVATDVGEGTNVSAYVINPISGALTPVASSPYRIFATQLAVDPSGRFLYGTNPSDSMSVFSINQAQGGLTEVPGSPFKVNVRPGGIVIIRPN